jgi:hypothetical protein
MAWNNFRNLTVGKVLKLLMMFLAPLFLAVLLGQAPAQTIPGNALIIDQKALNALETVQPPSVQNFTTVN